MDKNIYAAIAAALFEFEGNNLFPKQPRMPPMKQNQ